MDKIIRATAGDGSIKMAVITAKDLVQRAREIHGTSPTASAALGRSLCAASLMGDMMKEDDATLTLRINGGGPNRQHRGRVRLRRKCPGIRGKSQSRSPSAL
ncbi:MAG: Hsp33 family molecular chaperone HslO [Oscillospiraceae bacterium]